MHTVFSSCLVSLDLPVSLEAVLAGGEEMGDLLGEGALDKGVLARGLLGTGTTLKPGLAAAVGP